MKKLLASLMLCFFLGQGNVNADNTVSLEDSFINRHCRHHHSHHSHHSHHESKHPIPIPTGFDVYASYFSTSGTTITTGNNILFDTQESLEGITYNTSTGVFTLPKGTYVITYFFNPDIEGSVNLVVNNDQILNAPLSGGSVILDLDNPSNTVSLQVTSGSFNPGTPDTGSSNASISIFKIAE
jgi:hypothetical protein